MHFPTQVESSRSVPDPDGVDAKDAWMQGIIWDGGEIQADSGHRTAGVLVFCWSRVWLGVSRVCPKDRWLLQRFVHQCDRR